MFFPLLKSHLFSKFLCPKPPCLLCAPFTSFLCLRSRLSLLFPEAPHLGCLHVCWWLMPGALLCQWTGSKGGVCLFRRDTQHQGSTGSGAPALLPLVDSSESEFRRGVSELAEFTSIKILDEKDCSAREEKIILEGFCLTYLRAKCSLGFGATVCM